MRRGPWRAAGWLSVVLPLWLSGAALAQTGLQYVQTVPDGAVFRWEYYLIPTVEVPPNAELTISGLTDVQGATVVPSAGWTATFTVNSATFRWDGPGNLSPGSPYPGPPPAYFGYLSSSDNPAPMAWALSGGLGSGTVAGAAPTVAGVAAYDNWITFGSLPPGEGTHSSPAEVIAAGSPASDWGPTATIPAVGSYDVGYLAISAPVRLRLALRLGGHLKRCTPTGQAFDGIDARKQVPGPHELATQWKVDFLGRFLTLGGDPYASPTSGAVTDYDVWSGWSLGGDDPVSDSGWLWPSATDAWSGAAVSGYPSVTGLDLLVERDQFAGSITGGPAGFCLIERLLRRGQHDVGGNYRQDISIILTYAE